MREAAYVLLPLALIAASPPAAEAGPGAIEHGLVVRAPDGTTSTLDLDAALRALKVPSASIALIDGGEIAFARAYGAGASPDTLYQAASLSKFVAAIGALRLVEQGRLNLDRDVNERLTTWQLPPGAADHQGKVTLRGLLSMTAGIGVPGFLGYAAGAKLPTLIDILNGTPPANSDAVTRAYAPGSYHYSGGGYEIAEALMQDATGKSFPTLMQDLVLAPAAMGSSSFEPILPRPLAARAASGHFSDGGEVPGRWHLFPEHAAASLWSTPSDIAKLLVALGKAWHGGKNPLLGRATLAEIFTRQDGGPYGLGAAVEGEGRSLVLMKRGQNVGYQGYLIFYPAAGQGMVVLTSSDNGSKLAEALIKRAALAYGWPSLPPLAD